MMPKLISQCDSVVVSVAQGGRQSTRQDADACTSADILDLADEGSDTWRNFSSSQEECFPDFPSFLVPINDSTSINVAIEPTT